MEPLSIIMNRRAFYRSRPRSAEQGCLTARDVGSLVFTVDLLAGAAVPPEILVVVEGLFSALIFKDRERGRGLRTSIA